MLNALYDETVLEDERRIGLLVRVYVEGFLPS